MIKITFKFLLLIVVEHIGLIFSLILIYASPDNKMAHTYEASIFFLASSIVTFSLSHNISFKVENNNLMKYLYSFVLIQFVLTGMVLGVICKYAHPMEIVDLSAMYLFFIASFITFLGFIFMLKHNKGSSNE